jgi:2-iminoacetate synthase ThiH
MANFSSFNYKKNGAQHLKDNANTIALALNVTSADSYAAASAKIIASAAMTSGDVALTAGANDLKVTVNGKSIDPTATGDVADDLVTLLIDSLGEEIIICQDATDRYITNEEGDMVIIPAMIIYNRELTQV